MHSVVEFDGHEDHLFVADILQIVHLELARGVSLVAGLPWRVGVFDGLPSLTCWRPRPPVTQVQK